MKTSVPQNKEMYVWVAIGILWFGWIAYNIIAHGI
jgi:hypothetical protein